MMASIFTLTKIISRQVCRPGIQLSRRSSSKLERLDWDYLSDPENTLAIKENIKIRKGVGDIDSVLHHKKLLDSANTEQRESIRGLLLEDALRIPNKTHPSLTSNDSPVLVKRLGSKATYDFTPATFEALSKRWRLTKTDTSVFTGPRSYYLLDQLADLEAALVNYSVDILRSKGFRLVSVPDVLPREVIQDCGMETKGIRSQVYALGGEHTEDNLCLSGTAEMGISFLLRDTHFCTEDLPQRIAAVSRCFRAETSKISEEKGIYRVHQFTKVEMYGVYLPGCSEEGLQEFRSIQEEFFGSLGLEMQILDMPPCELGAQAYRKFDVEAYFPGKDRWGELSSASDCTDYQSRRLNITYDSGKFPHTINGTACAVPRAIVAIMETHQRSDGSVHVPKCLVPYLGFNKIAKSKVPKMVPVNIKKRSDRTQPVSDEDEQLSGTSQ